MDKISDVKKLWVWTVGCTVVSFTKMEKIGEADLTGKVEGLFH